MKRRVWLGLLLAAGWFVAGKAVAQDDYPFPVEERNRLAPIRGGDKPFKDGSMAANQEAVNHAAKWAVMRITDPVNRNEKTGSPVPMNKLVTDAAALMIDMEKIIKQPTEGQRDYIQALGKAMLVHLRPILGSKDKPSSFPALKGLIVRVNAARILSFLGKSGFEETADLAIDVIDNPNESDAVRLFALQAIRNLLAAPNFDNPKASCITKSDRELKTAEALIAFIGRKPPLNADATAEEIEAVRYVRREAVKALGWIRKPVIRKDKAIVADPALWLLKVVAMDQAIPLVPNLQERMEATIGYLQLNPDRAQNVDFAIYYIGAAIVEFATLANTRANPKLGPPEPMPGKEVSPQEYYGWKLASTRLLGAMKEWKEAWDQDHPNSPQPQTRMVSELVEKTKLHMIDPILAIGDRKDTDVDLLRKWWEEQKWPNDKLYKEDATSVMTPIKRGP
jgi:hypothetical protein